MPDPTIPPSDRPYPGTEILREPLERPFRVLTLHVRAASGRTAPTLSRDTGEMLAILRRHCLASPELDASLDAAQASLAALAEAMPRDAAQDLTTFEGARETARLALFDLKARLARAAPSDESDGLWKGALSRLPGDEA